MKIILLSKAHFDEVCHKMNLAFCTAGNLPTPTLIVPLADTVYMIGEQVEVTRCDTEEFQKFLDGAPLSLTAMKLYISAKAEVSHVG